MSTPSLDVLVYGLGAIGSFYSFILSRNQNVRLTVVARSNYEAVYANGIHLNSGNHGENHFRPHQVVKTVAEADRKFDYIVCAHKAIDQSSVPEQIQDGVDESKTTIVIIQNGVGNEEPFRKRFPAATIISCVTWCGVRQPQPGVITHTKSEDMQMGLFPSSATGPEIEMIEKAKLDTFATLLTTGKTVFQVVPNIQVQRWEKVVWNAAWNPLTTLTLLDTHAWLNSSDDAMPMTRRVMKEVIDVAQALEVPIEYSLIDRLITKIQGMPPIGSSMRTDFENGKQIEADIILGYPVRKGRELGIPVTTIETLHTILTAINQRLMAGSSG